MIVVSLGFASSIPPLPTLQEVQSKHLYWETSLPPGPLVHRKTSEYFLTDEYDYTIFQKQGKLKFHKIINKHSNLRMRFFTGFAGYNQKTNNHYFAYYGSKATINIDDKLLMWVYWWNTHFDKDPKLVDDPIIDGWTHYEKMVLNYAGAMRYLFKYGYLDVGRGKQQIGENISSSIILNDACNDYGYLHYKVYLTKTLHTSITHLSLIPDSLNTSGLYDEKHLAIHQLHWYPNGFRIFFGQMVVYGNRGIEVNYLVPLPFYMLIEHNLRDRDNVLMFGGFRKAISETSLIYVNFLLDELKVKEVFGNWWGNKYAVQMGITHQWNAVLGSTFEFTAVRPWLYTHKFLVNKLSNDGVSLGYEEGSNLIQAAFELNCALSRKLELDFFTSYTRQGSYANQYYFNYSDIQDSSNDTADWLQGKISNKLKLMPVFTYKYSQMHKIKLGAEFIRINEEFTDPSFFINYQFTY